MLIYTRDFFNNVILSCDEVQKRIAPFFEGIDMEGIDKLIDEELRKPRDRRDSFDGNIELPNYKIIYYRDYKQLNALYAGDKGALEKISKIIIESLDNDLHISISGDDNHLTVKRTSEIEHREVSFTLNPTGLLEIAQTERIKIKQDMKELSGRALKIGSIQTQKRPE